MLRLVPQPFREARHNLSLQKASRRVLRASHSANTETRRTKGQRQYTRYKGRARRQLASKRLQACNALKWAAFVPDCRRSCLCKRRVQAAAFGADHFCFVPFRARCQVRPPRLVLIPYTRAVYDPAMTLLLRTFAATPVFCLDVMSPDAFLWVRLRSNAPRDTGAGETTPSAFLPSAFGPRVL